MEIAILGVDLSKGLATLRPYVFGGAGAYVGIGADQQGRCFVEFRDGRSIARRYMAGEAMAPGCVSIRLEHLSLMAKAHSGEIFFEPGTGYRMGRAVVLHTLWLGGSSDWVEPAVHRSSLVSIPSATGQLSLPRLRKSIDTELKKITKHNRNNGNPVSLTIGGISVTINSRWLRALKKWQTAAVGAMDGQVVLATDGMAILYGLPLRSVTPPEPAFLRQTLRPRGEHKHAERCRWLGTMAIHRTDQRFPMIDE